MMLTIALTTAALVAVPQAADRAVVQAHARATIVRGVTAAAPRPDATLQPDFAAPRVRVCDGPAVCRLIVTDLP